MMTHLVARLGSAAAVGAGVVCFSVAIGPAAGAIVAVAGHALHRCVLWTKRKTCTEIPFPRDVTASPRMEGQMLWCNSPCLWKHCVY